MSIIQEQVHQYLIKLSFLMTEQKVPLRVEVPDGLPNIGNTCFLNSVLQQLYAIQVVRLSFENANDGELAYQPLLSNIKQLFALMTARRTLNTRKVLQKIIKILEEKLQGYHFGDQFDSYQVFLHILNNIFQTFSLKSLFQIQYTVKCQCFPQKMKIKQMKIQSQVSTCVGCNRRYQRIVEVPPQYLLVVHGQGSGLIKELRQSRIYYEKQSMNIYNGSGKSGHYYSICKYGDNNAYTFNDSLRDDNNQMKERGKVMFTIYKKTNNPPPPSPPIDGGHPQNEMSLRTKIMIGILIALAIAVLISLVVVFTNKSSPQTQQSYQLPPSKTKYSNLSTDSQKYEHTSILPKSASTIPQKNDEENQLDTENELQSESNDVQDTHVNQQPKPGKKGNENSKTNKRNSRSSEQKKSTLPQ